MSINEKQRFTDNTYSLAKGLHHINIAKEYFEDVRLGSTGDVKMIFNNYIQRCDWILTNMTHRMSQESREALKRELSGSFSMEAINDKIIHLDSKQRDIIENIMDRMISGEQIEVV